MKDCFTVLTVCHFICQKYVWHFVLQDRYLWSASSLGPNLSTNTSKTSRYSRVDSRKWPWIRLFWWTNWWKDASKTTLSFCNGSSVSSMPITKDKTTTLSRQGETHLSARAEVVAGCQDPAPGCLWQALMVIPAHHNPDPLRAEAHQVWSSITRWSVNTKRVVWGLVQKGSERANHRPQWLML